MGNVFPRIEVGEPPEEFDIVGKFYVCRICEYREGALLTQHQEKCVHDWVEFTRLRNGTIYVSIMPPPLEMEELDYGPTWGMMAILWVLMVLVFIAVIFITG